MSMTSLALSKTLLTIPLSGTIVRLRADRNAREDGVAMMLVDRFDFMLMLRTG